MSSTKGSPAHLRPITVEISRFWSPEEALAVFELIDDIRDKILALHGDQIREWLRERRGDVEPVPCPDAGSDDQPF